MSITTHDEFAPLKEARGLREVTSFCRICGGGCGTRLKIDAADHIVDIRGDRKQPMSRGYACFKGLQAEEAHHGPARLLRPLKRTASGSYEEIGLEQALDEIAETMRPYYDSGNKDAIALFNGNGSTPCSSAHGMHYSFMESLGSRSHFTTLTIDQSSKLVAFERMGGWPAGLHSIEQSGVTLYFGANPLISHAAVGSVTADPVKRLRSSIQNGGLKLIVVDPRRTETARFAALFLQPLPGQDAAIAAALIRIVLDEGWHDREFCARYVTRDGLASLREVVEPFTEAFVERRADLPEGELRKVAEMFARDHKTGAAFSATGPSMAPHSNLMQHMVDALNVVCGRYRRVGDRIAVDMLSPENLIREGVVSPPRSWETVPPSRIRGVGRLFREKLSGTLPEEILTSGPGQVRCLIVSGANPASSVPDTPRMVKALKDLDLLVTIDPYVTQTARLSHYILPPKMQYERADLPLSIPGFSLFPENWTQYTPAILKPPPGSEVVDDWYPFWAIARRLGFGIHYVGKEMLDSETAPTTDDLLAIRLRGARVSLDELKQYPSGKIFDVETCFVQPRLPENDATFDIMPPDVRDEIAHFLQLTVSSGDIRSHGKRFTHLLSSRRLRDAFNSNGPQISTIRKRTPYNPAFLNPGDMNKLDLLAGDRIRITSDYGEIEAIVQPEEALRTGVVSIAHGWGGLPEDAQSNWDGSANVNMLIACDRDVETVNAMPRMSAVPVNICAA